MPEKKALQKTIDDESVKDTAKENRPLNLRLFAGLQEILHNKGLLSGMLLLFFYVG